MLINSIFLWFFEKRIKEIEMFKENYSEIQNKTLFELINRAKNTEFGKKYDFKSIRNEKDFANRVPLQDYESLKPYIKRLMKGEKNILWDKNIRFFAKSSGTTNDKSKFIPLTDESLKNCHYKSGKDIMAFYVSQNPSTKIFTGKTLTLGGSQKITKNKNNLSYVGDLSAILIQNLPFWAEYIRTPKLKITLMDEWEKKILLTTKSIIKENVKILSGVPSWMLVLLKKVLEVTKKNNLSEIWENLELFVHGGVSFIPYREQFKKIISSDNMKFLETYNASEGFFSIQNDLNSDDMLLMIDYGIYFEFINMKNIKEENPKTLKLDEVEVNENYAMVITTNGGLWRYVIGDTVIFTSKKPFKIKITGRIKHFINAFGEELIIDNAEKALNIATSNTNSLIKEYTAAPIFMKDNKKGGHEWLIEFEKKPDNIKNFTEILDKSLKELNSDYEAKRYKNMTLDFPKIKIAKKGIFYKWLKQKNKLGGQNKIPRLANDRKYIDELLII